VDKQFYISNGMLHSSKKFAQQYGYFETRAKAPTGMGFNAAFWLMGYSGWPPEIDVFELLGREPNVLRMANHFNSKDSVHNQVSGSHVIPDFSLEFHTYAVEWNPDEIIWYFDDEPVFRSRTAVPQEPMY